MYKIVKFFRKGLLWLITTCIPFVIAACYGPMSPMDYPPDGYNSREIGSTGGLVIDKYTRAGIFGISVKCIVNEGSSQYVEAQTSTDYDGNFHIEYQNECDMLVFKDMDGEANGGLYNQVVIDFSEFLTDRVVEMEREK